MEVQSALKKDLVKHFNELHGDDLLDLEKCYYIKKSIENDIVKIKAKLSIDNTASIIGNCVREVNACRSEINNANDRTTNVIENFATHLEDTNQIRKQLITYFKKLDTLECTSQYIKVIQEIEKLCDDLETEVSKKDDEKCVTIFANISEIVRNLPNFHGSNLHGYLMETLLYWHGVLKGIFLSYEDTQESYLRFGSVEGMVQLAPQFWYFTKILTWIRDHTEFVDKYVQPVVDKMGFHHIDTKNELMRGLVQLAVEKLYTDLPALQYDDFTFSHCIDEALAFDKELKDTYEYPTSQPGILVVLTQGQVFMKWMNMEKKYALEKMDMMLADSLSNVFQPIDADLEDFKITPCAEMFVTLLQTITERYELLPQPGHRLQFLELQLELLDDFRVRLLQLVHVDEDHKDIDTRMAMIVNTIYYIETILLDWGTMLHFLNLQYYRSQIHNTEISTKVISNIELDDSLLASVESDTVFNTTLSLYCHMRKDLLFTLAESVISSAKARGRQYICEMWSRMKVPNDIRSLSLTPSGCPFFEILVTKLHQLNKNLTSKLFTMVWRSIARQIDSFLFDELVLENRFSDGGASQFKYDITRNLFPLFSQFTDTPESYFSQLAESCCLLNLTKGSALLLRETLLALEGATGVEDRRPQALKEVGIQAFGPKIAVTVLNRRTDITVDRIMFD